LAAVERLETENVVFAGTWPPGLFLISFLDSSVLTFPSSTICCSSNSPSNIPCACRFTPRWPAWLAAGACALFPGKKGGEAFFIKKRAAARTPSGTGGEKWIWRMLLAALLPPPTPFKILYLPPACFEVPLVSFASAIALARAIRYFGIGYWPSATARTRCRFWRSTNWKSQSR